MLLILYRFRQINLRIKQSLEVLTNHTIAIDVWQRCRGFVLEGKKGKTKQAPILSTPVYISFYVLLGHHENCMWNFNT